MDLPPLRPPPQSPFICNIPDCGKSFLRKEHLNRHLHTHSDSRRHKCYICGRSFARSDILNRHVLQHNVPSEGAKRTPLACQTCRRRKTKCDSNYPCSTCANTGDTCVREPSRMQAWTPTARSHRKVSLGREKRLYEAMDGGEEGEDEDDAAEGEGTGTREMANNDNTPVMGQDWVSAPMHRNNSSSMDTAMPPPLEPSASMPAASIPNPTSAKSLSLYFGEASSPLGFTLDLPPPTSSECGDHFNPDQPFERQISESASSGSNRGSTASSGAWLQLNDAMTSQIQLVAAQIKSSEFDHFHQAWPFLHVPTFTLERPSTLLMRALTNLTGWMGNANRQHLVPSAINQELTRALMPKITEEAFTEKPVSDIPLQTLQALVITLIYAITGHTSMSTLNWAAQWTDIAISTLRRLGVLNDRWLPEDQRQATEERWVLGEQMKRLVFVVLRIDAYLSVILDRPPTLRYQEIRLPLPVSDDLWRAETREARTRLHWYEPVGRTRSAFSTMMRGGKESQGFMTGYLRMPILSLQDKHFSLCAFLSDLWGILKEAHEEHHLHYRSPELHHHTADRVQTWKGYLQDWIANIEKTDNLEDTFFAEGLGDRSPFLGLNLTLYHLHWLKLYANTSLLEHKKCCAHCPEADVENVISTWAQSVESRWAVYHAAQLKRIYERESRLYKLNDRRLSNVLAPAGLLASAIVLCSYSSKVSSISTPEGDAVTMPVESIELTQPKLSTTPEYESWIEQGGLANVDGVPLHVFSVPCLSSWYRDQLASSPVYSSRLITFLLTLKI